MLSRLVAHELRLLVREPRFWFPFLLPPFILAGTQLWILSMAGAGASAGNPMLLYSMGALLTAMGGTLGADSFAGERERNTLEPLLSLPVPLHLFFWAKVLVIVPVPIIAAWFFQSLFWILFPGENVWILINALIYSAALGLLLAGLAVLVSLRAQSVRAAAQTSALFALAAILVTQWMAPLFMASRGWSLGALSVGVIGFLLAIRRSQHRFTRA